MNPWINFRSWAQVILYECELKGQISDGHWENAYPHDHYKVPCDAMACMDPDNLGKNFKAARNYNFVSKDLLEAVSYRMINFVKFYRVFRNASFNKHWDFTFNNNPMDLYANFEAGDFTLSDVGIYEDGNGEQKFLEKLHEVAEYNYTEKDLLNDLRDMKKIWKMECK